MPAVKLRSESRELGDFYVPQFAVRVQGGGLPDDLLRDAVQVSYRDNIREIDSFELTVNNWDAATRDFKYIGTESAKTLSASTPEAQRQHLFEPCAKVFELYMGYAGKLTAMMKGSCTTMEPSFPASGGPTLTVRALNVLHKLRRKQYSDSWTSKRDSEIATAIGNATDPETHSRRFPIPIHIDDAAQAREQPVDYVAQQNQYDIDFLFQRARQMGYVVYVGQEPGPSGQPPQEFLYFGPSQARQPGLRDVTYELEWGISLTDFKPTLSTANQVRSVTVRNWNRRTNRRIEARVGLDDAGIDINADLISLLTRDGCDPRDDVMVDEPMFTPEQAQRRALAILSDKLKEMVTAEGTTVGLPDLRAGQRVEIRGVGSRFSGTYFVTESTHTINDSGYVTRFTARREQRAQGGSA
jgi:phage protein D